MVIHDITSDALRVFFADRWKGEGLDCKFFSIESRLYWEKDGGIKDF
jgi:hypothetical protein